jgi:hypothetical protein
METLMIEILTDDCDVSQNWLQIEQAGSGDLYVTTTGVVRLSTAGGAIRRYPHLIRGMLNQLNNAEVEPEPIVNTRPSTTDYKAKFEALAYDLLRYANEPGVARNEAIIDLVTKHAKGGQG